MGDVAATMKVLESDQQALLGGEPEIDDEQEEFVEIEDDDTASELDDKPAAKVTAKPAAKPAVKAPVKKEGAATTAVAADDDSALPEPLRGKSRAEIAKMYTEAHQTIGRQGSELGDFRRKADMLIQASLASLQAAKKPAAAEPAKPEEIDESEFFANPKEAIRKAVENHPLVKKLQESQGNLAADQQRRAMEGNAARFNAAHPDAGTIMQDPKFLEWVQKSPVRTGLLKRAHERYDFAAGDDVFSTWKELVAARKPAVDPAAAAGDGTAAAATNPASEAGRTLAAAAKAKRAAAAAEAAAPTGGGGTAAAGKKKIYRRADILKLMETDQDRYAAMADEIALAYAEKRVR